ncbi:MAG: NUDIX domain-containing protein [Pseudomonadota bacterium]
MRRYGIREAGRRYTARPGAYGVVVRGRRAMLVLNECPGEEVALPGGGIDPGESPIRALHREAMEETGWRIRPVARVGAFRRFVYMPEYDLWAEKVCHVYLCAAGRRVAEPEEADHRPVWLDVEAAAAALSVPADRAAFRAAIAASGLF